MMLPTGSIMDIIAVGEYEVGETLAITTKGSPKDGK
jgi:hypothetical protein